MTVVYRDKNSLLFIGMVILVFLLVWVACTKKNPVDPEKPIEEELNILTNMSATPGIIVEGSTSIIRVCLLNANEEAVNNQNVNFSTDIGNLDPAQAVTNENGWAEVEFSSDSEIGTATIAAKSEHSISSAVQVKIVSLYESSLVISASRPSILANGIDTTKIKIFLNADSVNASGVIVALNAEPGRINPSSVILDENGKAEAVLTSFAKQGDTTAVISASSDSLDASDIAVVFKGITFLLSQESNSILADGKSSTTIRAKIKETESQIAVTSCQVSFSTSLGTIPASAATNSSGIAEVALVSENDTGRAEIIGRYGNMLSDTVYVDFVESEYSFKVSANPVYILANGMESSEITVEVEDGAGSSAEGVNVSFETNSGTFSLSDTSVVTNSSGIAQTVLLPVTSVGVNQTAIISVTVYGVTETVQVLFHGIQYSITSNPNSILADGIDKSTITVVLKKVNQVAIPNASVTFSTDAGTIPNQAVTNSAGVAQVELTSSTVERTAHVTAVYGGIVMGPAEVEFVDVAEEGFTVSEITLSDQMILGNGFDNSMIRVKVVDSNTSAPVSGVTVDFDVNIGTIQAQAVTNSSGIAQACLTSSVVSVTNETAHVTVTFNTDYNVDVIFEAIDYTLSVNPDTILAGGQSSSEIVFKLKKAETQVAISEAVIEFGSDRGTIPNQEITNSQGIAKVNLTSSSTAGVTAHVTGRYGPFITVEDSVYFASEVTTTNTLTDIKVSSYTLLANGFDQTTISARVLDSNSQPVEGVELDFSTSNAGYVVPHGITENDGWANVQLTASANSNDVNTTVTVALQVQSIETDFITFEGVDLKIYVSPDTILANGQSKSQVRAVIKKSTSHIAVPNAVVYFASDHGTIPNQAVTNSQGVAEVELTSGSDPADAVVTITYGPVLSVSDTVVFQESVPAYLDVSVSPSVIKADGASTSNITAIVTDANRNAVPDGTPVTFSLNGSGSILKRHQSTVNGEAVGVLRSGTKPDTVEVNVRVTSTIDTTVNVYYEIGDIDKISVTTFKDTLRANGIDTTHVKAKVVDAQGNPFKNKTVNFSASIGNITPNSLTDSAGVARAVFSSGKVGYSTISAIAEGSSSISGNTTVVLIPGKANSIIMTFDPVTIGVYGTGQNQTALVEADVRDAKNNPVTDGTNVIFRIVHGPGGGEALSTTDSIPTVAGKSRVSISSGIISGVVRVEAKTQIGGGEIVSESSEIMIQAGPPYMKDKDDFSTTHMTIVAERLNIWRNLGQTVLTVSVFDKYHNPVAQGRAVYLTASGGGVTTAPAYTDANGIANVVLYGANPQPTVNNFYHDRLMHNPNRRSKPLPGIVYYSVTDDTLIPNFEGWSSNGDIYDPPFMAGDTVDLNDIVDPSDDLADWTDVWDLILNSQENVCDFDTVGRYNYADTSVYHGLENDGIVRVIARTEGRDANGVSLLVWDQLAVVYSGLVDYKGNSHITLAGKQLAIGESANMYFSLMDDNGNPIESGTTITTSLTNAVDAELSWTEVVTSDGWGQDYYPLTISNSVDTTGKFKLGSTAIRIEWTNSHQTGWRVTSPVNIIIEH